MTVLKLRLPLPDPLADAALADAQRRRLTLRAWVVETVQAHLAGCACTHVGRLPVPDADGEPDDDAKPGRLPATGQDAPTAGPSTPQTGR